MFTAERASRNIRRPTPISLASAAPFTSNVISSPESILSLRRTDSPEPISSSPNFPVSSEQRSQHRRVMSTPTASSKFRITDKICPRKEKDKATTDPKPKPKPARTQPYGPPYNWIPPTPGAWAVAEAEAKAEETEHQRTIARRRKRASAPVQSPGSPDFARYEPERSGDVPIPNPVVQ